MRANLVVYLKSANSFNVEIARDGKVSESYLHKWVIGIGSKGNIIGVHGKVAVSILDWKLCIELTITIKFCYWNNIVIQQYCK